MSSLTSNGSEWSCPLLKITIDAGYCYDINAQWLGWFKPDILIDVQKKTEMSVEQISRICELCPSLPIK